MGTLDFLVGGGTGSRLAPPPSSGGFKYPAQPAQSKGLPERFNINQTFNDLSQQGASLFGTLGQLPSRVYESPVALADVATQRLAGFSPVDALSKTPVGAAGGFLGEAFQRSGNFVPSLINSTDANIWKVVGDLPDNTPITDDLVRKGLEQLGESSLFAEGEKTQGVAVLGALPFLRHIFGGRAKTVGEFRDELAKRGFFSDTEGNPLDPAQMAQDLRDGKRSTFDFGDRSINDNALVDLAGRVTTDPSNALFFVPGAGLAKIGAAAARILPAARLIRAGEIAAKAPAALDAAQAIEKGSKAGATLAGMAKVMKGYRTLSVGTAAGTFGLNQLASFAGNDVPFANEIEEFTKAVQDRKPMSGNAAFMLFSAATFPYHRYLENTKAGVKGARARVFGVGDMSPLHKEYGGRANFYDEFGGKAGERQLADFIDKQIIRDMRLLTPREVANIQSIADVSLRRRIEQTTLERMVDKARQKGLITGDMRLAKFKEWHASQAGFEGTGFANPWDPARAARRWRGFEPVRQMVDPILKDTGEVIWGLRDDVIFTEQVDLIRDALRQARYTDANGKVRVDTREILNVLEDHPNLNSLDRHGFWRKFADKNAEAPTWDAISRRLSRTRRESTKIEDYTRDMALWEQRAPKDLPEPKPIFNRDERIGELRDRLNELEAMHPHLPTPPDEAGVFYHGTTEANARSIETQGFRAEKFGQRETVPGAGGYTDYPGIYVTKDFRKAADYYATTADKPTNSVTGRGPVVRMRLDTTKFVPGGDRGSVWRGFKTEAQRNAFEKYADANGDIADAVRPEYEQFWRSETVRLAQDAGYTGVHTRVGTETIVFDPAVIKTEGVLRPDSGTLAPEIVAEHQAVQRELEGLLAEQNGVHWAKMAERDERSGADPVIGRQAEEALPAEIQPVHLSPGIDRLPPEVVGRVIDLERKLIEADPSYRLKRAPLREILALVPEDGAIATAIRQHSALGEWVHMNGPLSRVSGLIHGLTRPVSRDELFTDAKHALAAEMVGHGAKGSQVEAFLAELREEVKRSERHPFAFIPGLGDFTIRLKRDIGSIEPSEVNRIGAQVFGSKVTASVQGNFYRLLARSSSRYFRSLESRAEKGSQVAARAERVYRIWNDSPALTHVAAAQRTLAKYYYPLFRFVADARWLALNAVEANILALGKDGIRTAYKSADEATGAARYFRSGLDAEAAASFVPDTGWSLGRQLDLFALKLFDHRSLQSVGKVIDEFGTRDPAITALRDGMLREAQDNLANLERQFRDKEITERTYASQKARIEHQMRASTEDLSHHLNDTLYRYEKQGVGKTVDDEARAILDADQMRVMAPLIERVKEINEKTWNDVQHMLHGNPSRSTMERLANSYWLYWPISYQIKAGGWLADIMLGGSFGHDNNALLAGKYALWQQQHKDNLLNNPAYAALYQAQPTLWFTAQMFLPIGPEDIGVSLSRATRLIGTHEQDNLNKWLGTDIGVFTAYKELQDPGSMVGWLTDMGPMYTVELAKRIFSEGGSANKPQAFGPASTAPIPPTAGGQALASVR